MAFWIVEGGALRALRVIRDFDALMVAMREEFASGRIYQAEISSDGELVEGLYEPSSGSIYVDEAPNLVDTLIHELLHRRYPRWGEARVSRTAHNLVSAMSDEERRGWYRAFKRRAKKCRPVKVDA